MDKEQKARRLARNILLFHRREHLAPGAPELEQARAIFREKVAPALHPVFEDVAREQFEAGGASKSAARRRGRFVVALVVVTLLGLVGGAVYVAWRYVLVPGRRANISVLQAWMNQLRVGRATAPVHVGGSTERAMRAIAASRHHAITGHRGAYNLTGGTTCFDLVVSGPGGSANVIVQVADDPAPARVTHACTAPPCECQRNGRVSGWE